MQSTSFDFKSKGLLHIPHLRYKRVWLAIGFAMILTILILSLVTLPTEVNQVLWSDKLLHGIAYAGLMGWFAQLYKHDLVRLLLVVGLILFGISIELMQGLTPTRQFDVADMVANTSGIVLAWALSYTFFGNILEWFESLIYPKAAKV